MEHGGGRSSDQRQEDREARQRARTAREQGMPEPDERAEQRGEGWRGPDLGSMSRYGGGMDAFQRRRLLAGAAVVVVLLLLFVLLGGC